MRRGSTVLAGLTRPQWAKRLNDEWREFKETAVEGFLRLGRSLNDAKADLTKQKGHGGWMEMVREDLEFNQNVANCFMRIAKWFDENVMSPWREMLHACLAARAEFNDTERAFLHSMLSWHGNPTPKQMRWLVNLYEALA